MSDSRPGALRRLAHRLGRTPTEEHSAELRAETREVGLVHVRDLEQRTLATVRGEVRSVTIRPKADVPALIVELWDGTEALHLIWLGQRRIAGIVPGVKIQATGRVTRQRQVTTMFNPAYEVIGRPGATHG